MNIIDRASKRFSRVGDETVRTVDYDQLPDTDETEEPTQPKERRKLNLGAAAKGLLSKVNDHSSDHHDEEHDEQRELEIPSGELSPSLASRTTPKLTPIKGAFAIDESEPNFYEDKQKQWEKTQSGVVDGLVDAEGAIQDVLDVLKIPATFRLPEETLMPEDFDDLEFDLQLPQGYDQGQVRFFVERAETTVRELLQLLELRNEHVAQLATTIDRLQVDANNLKYDSQLSAAIGIMPTSESADLENENMALKLELQRMKDAQNSSLNTEERKLYNDIRNELSKKDRKIEELEEGNRELRTVIANMEEDADDMVTAPSLVSDHESAEIIFETMDDDEMPDLSQLDGDLPATVDVAPAGGLSQKPTSSGSSFDIPEDDVADFLDTIQPVDKMNEEEDDDEDDALDLLMKGWNK